MRSRPESPGQSVLCLSAVRAGGPFCILTLPQDSQLMAQLTTRLTTSSTPDSPVALPDALTCGFERWRDASKASPAGAA
jgi:hypothetical protein